MLADGEAARETLASSEPILNDINFPTGWCDLQAETWKLTVPKIAIQRRLSDDCCSGPGGASCLSAECHTQRNLIAGRD